MPLTADCMGIAFTPTGNVAAKATTNAISTRVTRVNIIDQVLPHPA